MGGPTAVPGARRPVKPLASAAALVLLLGGSVVAPVASAQEEPPVLAPLEIAPLRTGLVAWDRSGPEGVFQWAREGAVLEFQGKSGGESARCVYARRAWDEFEATFRLRKGTARLRILLVPRDGQGPVAMDLPRGSMASDKWTDASLRVRAGRALLTVGRKEESIGLPEGAFLSLGFEVPAAATGALTDLRLVRRYENGPQVCEEGFRSLFDGTSLGRWVPAAREDAPAFDVAGGILRGAVRTRDAGMLLLPDLEARGYELRFRVLWPTSGLTLVLDDPPSLARPAVAGHLVLLLTSHVEEDDVCDVVLRVLPGSWTVDVNGRRVVDEAPDGGATGPRRERATLGFLVLRGNRLHVRDLRIRDLPGPEGGAAEKPPR